MLHLTLLFQILTSTISAQFFFFIINRGHCYLPQFQKDKGIKIKGKHSVVWQDLPLYYKIHLTH